MYNSRAEFTDIDEPNKAMTTSVYIDGQSGTTGLEIRARLDAHSSVDVLLIDEAERKDPAARQALLQRADVAVLCLPDDAARDAVALIGDSDTRVIDASTAHRVHPDWTYGLPELPEQRESIENATRVANPGCYPQGYLLFVRPLVDAGLLPTNAALSVNAVSGYSGGGRQMVERYRDAIDDRSSISVRPYALSLQHKHAPEMREYSGLRLAPVFAPSVADYYKGMLVQVPLQLATLPGRPTLATVHKTLVDTYAEEPFIHVQALGQDDGEDSGYLEPTVCNDTNDVDLFVFGNDDQALLIARYDNLGKGAAGSAVQCMNLMLGLPETSALISKQENFQTKTRGVTRT